MVNKSKWYTGLDKKKFFALMVFGFLVMLVGGMNSNTPLGSGIFGMGFSTCLLLLEMKLNSISKVK